MTTLCRVVGELSSRPTVSAREINPFLPSPLPSKGGFKALPPKENSELGTPVCDEIMGASRYSPSLYTSLPEIWIGMGSKLDLPCASSSHE